MLALVITTLAVLERVAVVAAGKLAFPSALTLLVLVGGWGVLVLLVHRLRPALSRFASNRASLTIRLALVAWLVSLAAFTVVYPIVDSGRLGFESDREEAIDVAVRALVRGEFPYACRVKSGIHEGCLDEGNAIGPWPGSFLLSAPVVLTLGSAGWLSLLCLPLAVWMLGRARGDPSEAVVTVATLLAVAPIVAAEILTGGDLFVNCVLVLGPLSLLVQSPKRRGALAFAVLLGLALSWRGLLWMVVPSALASFVAQRRFAELVRIGVTALAAFVLVTLPLYLWQPDQFMPWQVQQKLSLFTEVLPFADRAFPLLALVVGLVLGWRARTTSALLNACGWSLLIPVLGAVLLYSIQQGHPTCGFYGWYALPALLAFGLAAGRGSPRADALARL